MASTFVPSLATSPRPSDQEIARAQAVARRREELAKEREAFVSDFVKSKRADIQASATANEYLDVDGPGRRGVVRVGTPAAPVIDEDGLRTQALSAWKGEVARRIGESQRAEMSKIRSFLDARMKLMPGEPPEAFEMRKFAASQELGKRRGIPVEPAPNDVVGTVGYIGEVGRSLARGVTGVTKSLTSDLPVLAGTIGERMGFLGSSNLVAGGRAVGEAIESVVPEAGIQPSMAAQGAGMLDPRFYASRLPETAVQLGATMAPGIGIAGAAGRAGLAGARALGVGAATGVGTALEATNAFDEGYQSYIQSGMPDQEARRLASTEAVLYAPLSAMLESVPAGEFVAKSPGVRRRLLGLMRGAFAEGSTEAAQQLTQDLIHLGVSGQEADWRALGRRLAESGVLGASAGGGLGSVRPGAPPVKQPPVQPPPVKQPPVQPPPPNVPRGTSNPVPQPGQTPDGSDVSDPASFARDRLAAIQESLDSGRVSPDTPGLAQLVSELQKIAASSPKGTSFNVPNQEPPGRTEATGIADGQPGDGADGSVQRDQPVAVDQPPPDRAHDVSEPPAAVAPPVPDQPPPDRAHDVSEPPAAVAPPVPEQPPQEAFQIVKPNRGEYSKKSMMDRIEAEAGAVVEAEQQALDPEILLQQQQGRQAQSVADLGMGEDILTDAFSGDESRALASAEMRRSGRAGRRRRALEVARGGGAGGQAAMLAYQLDLQQENGPADRVLTITNPASLPVGSEFTISGVAHSVADRNGQRVLVGPKKTIPLVGVERVYVDEGSIGVGTGAAVEPSTTGETSITDDLPISPKSRTETLPSPAPASAASNVVAKIQAGLRPGESFVVTGPITRGDRQAVAVAKRLGIEPVFFRGNVRFEGVFDPENPSVVVMESGQTEKNVRKLLTHEWMHDFERSNPAEFRRLAETLERVAPGQLAAALGLSSDRRSASDVGPLAESSELSEAMAELLGDNANAAGFWSKLAGESASFWEKLIDALRRLVARVGMSSPVARELLRTVESAAARRDAGAAAPTQTGGGSPMFSPTRKEVEAKAKEPNIGRPDLANWGLSEQSRKLIDALDEFRGDVTDQYARDDAKIRALASDQSALLRRVEKSVATGTESIDDVYAMKVLANNAVTKAVVSTDEASLQEAIRVHDLARRQGTVAGRELAARYDPVRSWSRRMMNSLGRMIFDPPHRVQLEIESLEKTIRDTASNTDEVRKAKTRLEKIKAAEEARIRKTREAISQAGLIEKLEVAEKVSKESEAAMEAARAMAQKEREALSKKIFEATAALNDSEQKLIAAQGQIAELKGEAADVAKQRAELEKRAAELEKKSKEAKAESDRLRRQRHEMSEREAALSQQILNWASGQKIDAEKIKVVTPEPKPGVPGGGGPGGGGPGVRGVSAPKFLNMPGQQDLGGSENAGALTVKGGPDPPTLEGSDIPAFTIGAQSLLQLPGLDKTYEGSDIPAFTIGAQSLIQLPDGRRLTHAEFQQLLKGTSTATPWSDSTGAKGNQRVFPRRAVLEGMRIAQVNSGATVWDKLSEWWRNAVLSAPKTQSVNFTSTNFNAWHEVFVMNSLRAAVNESAKLFGGKPLDENSIEFRDLKGIFSAASKAFARAKIGFMQTWYTETLSLETEIEDAAGVSREKKGGDDQAYANAPAIGGAAGRVIRSPQRLMAAADEANVGWITTVTASMLAHRIARNEGLVGDAATARIDDIMEDAAHPVWMEALTEARRIAFKTPVKELGGVVGAVANAMMTFRNKVWEIPNIGPPLAALVVQPIIPFITTPANIIRSVLLSTPLGATPRAASRMFRASLPPGTPGYQRYTGKMKVDDIARNTIAWGVQLALAAIIMGGDDEFPPLTGRMPSEPSERDRWRRLGILPYAVRIGDRYVSYERLEPFASALALNIDVVHAMGKAVSGEGVGAGVKQLSSGLLTIAMDKSYLTGLSDVIEMAVNMKSGRSDLGFQNYVANYVRAWVPNLIRSTMREFDPVVRETETLGPRGDSGFAKGLGEKILYGAAPSLAQRNLPPKHDIWGREIAKANDFGPAFGPLMRMLLPVDIGKSTVPDKIDQLDLMVDRWNEKQTRQDRVISLTTPEDTYTRDGKTIPMTAEQYARFTRESGQLAAKNILRFNLNFDNPGEREYNIVRTQIRDARKVVRDRIKAENAK